MAVEIPWDVEDDPDDLARHGYWRNREKMLAAEYTVEVDISLWDSPYSKSALHRRRVINQAEVFRSPQMANPSYLTKDQVAALEQVTGPWPRPPRRIRQSAGGKAATLVEGDDLTRDVLMLEAIDQVRTHYEARHYQVDIIDDSARPWDLCVRKGGVALRIRVKGTTGLQPIVTLSQADLNQASHDPDWMLVVVTGILARTPTLHECPGLWVTREATPFDSGQKAQQPARYVADFSVHPPSAYSW
jgi:hypothetical protein